MVVSVYFLVIRNTHEQKNEIHYNTHNNLNNGID